MVSNNITGDKSENRFYVFSGEQSSSTFQDFSEITREHLEKYNKDSMNFKLLYLAGPKLIVRKMNVEIETIHPSIELLSDSKLRKYVDFYLLNQRLPFHALYSPLASLGIAQLPFNEGVSPILWKFENKEEYKELFENWSNLIISKYGARKLYFKERNLYFSKAFLKRGEINLTEETKVDDSNKLSIFSKKTLSQRLGLNEINNVLSGKKLRNEINFYKDKIGLSMHNWSPYSNDLFSSFEKKILLSN